MIEDGQFAELCRNRNTLGDTLVQSLRNIVDLELHVFNCN